MEKRRGIIALDLDGTLLNSDKQLSPGNIAALKAADSAGYEIVPTTGRFYNAIPEVVRDLPFVRYAITINGAAVEDLKTNEVIYRAEIPLMQAIDIMAMLDKWPVIYDCFMDSAAWVTDEFKNHVDEMIQSHHYRKMFRELRHSVPELKEFVKTQGKSIQKMQFFTCHPEVRLRLMTEIPQMFPNIYTSSSLPDNLEINQTRANKGEALLALAAHLGVPAENTVAFGDGTNDLTMIKMAGLGIAMENAVPEIKEVADRVTASCDEDGVAKGIELLLKY